MDYGGEIEAQLVEYVCLNLPMFDGVLRPSKDLTTAYLKDHHQELADVNPADFKYRVLLRSTDANIPATEVRGLSKDGWFRRIDVIRIVQIRVFWTTGDPPKPLSLDDATIRNRLLTIGIIDILVTLPPYFSKDTPTLGKDLTLLLPVITKQSNPYHALKRWMPDLPEFVLVHKNGLVPNGNMDEIARSLKWMPESYMELAMHGGFKPRNV